MTEGRRTSSRSGGKSARAAGAGRGELPASVDPLADIEARLARLEQGPGLRERGRGMMARVVPDEATRHFRNAGREHLMGVRSIVDFWIARIDETEGRSTRRTRHESIEID